MTAPVAPAGPKFTASGRQIKSRFGGIYGESNVDEQQGTAGVPAVENQYGAENGEDNLSRGRTRQGILRNGTGEKHRSRAHIESYNILDEMEDETDASSSGGEWEGGDDDEVDEHIVDDEDEDDADMSDDEMSIANDLDEVEMENKGEPHSLVVALRYQKKSSPSTGVNDLETTRSSSIDHTKAATLSNNTSGLATAKPAFRPEDSLYVKSDDPDDIASSI